MSKTVRIAIADDHAIVRKGLVGILKEGLNHPTIDEVGDAESLHKLLSKNDYDLVILDISLPGRSGLDALGDIKTLKPELPVLILSINPAEQYGLRALKGGGAGYLMKDVAPTELIKAVEQILNGRKYISAVVAQKLVDTLTEPDGEKSIAQLSNRELDVFKNLARGVSIKEIAQRLNLSVTTVSTYRSRVLEKMNFRNNAQIVHFAIENNLL